MMTIVMMIITVGDDVDYDDNGDISIADAVNAPADDMDDGDYDW